MQQVALNAASVIGGLVEHGALGPRLVQAGIVTNDDRVVWLDRAIIMSLVTLLAEHETPPQEENDDARTR